MSVVKMFTCFEIVQRKFRSRLKELDLSRNASRFLVEVLNSSLLVTKGEMLFAPKDFFIERPSVRAVLSFIIT